MLRFAKELCSPGAGSFVEHGFPGRLLAFTSCEDYSVCMSTSTDLGATWDPGHATAGAAGGGGEGSAKAPLHMAGLPFSGTPWPPKQSKATFFVKMCFFVFEGEKD